MTSLRSTTFVCICLLAAGACAQDFSGSYEANSEAGRFNLLLRPIGAGEYEGELVGEAGAFRLNCVAEGTTLSGIAGDDLDRFGFRATVQGETLTFTLFELGDDGEPLGKSAETIVFTSVGEETPALSGTQKTNKEVSINGLVLTDQQVAGLEETYGVRPLPGNYWYDSKCGLYGVAGYPSYGFMLPGHDFGTMDSGVSQGITEVFINGRELPVSEYSVWSYMAGSWIQPGRYWLDHQGNAGYEGNPTPAINLYMLAQQNSYKGQGGSGDNFWSTRFSAGNYNADNTQGYVSVPGYGPIGYGF
jgi:hypothetical protein